MLAGKEKEVKICNKFNSDTTHRNLSQKSNNKNKSVLLAYDSCKKLLSSMKEMRSFLFEPEKDLITSFQIGKDDFALYSN